MSKYPAGAHRTTLEDETIEQGDEIDFTIDLTFFRTNWRRLVLCIIGGMMCGAALSALMHPKYNATAIVQVGQTPVASNAGFGFSFELIEPPAQILERFRLRDTIAKVLSGAGLSMDGVTSSAASLAKTSLKVSVVKNTNFVEFSVGGYSTDEAEKTLASAVNLLLAGHNGEYSARAEKMHERLGSDNRGISEAVAEIAKLEASRANASASGKFESNIVAVSLIDAKQSDLRKLVADRFMVESAVAPNKSYPTAIIDGIYADRKPYFPQTVLFVSTAGLAGLALGILWAWVRRRKNRGYDASLSPK